MDKYIVLIVFLLVFSALLGGLAPKIKGWSGELTVARILSKLPQDEYKAINNVMLRTDRGTTQIDHIVVSAYGIFVIETKNYKGYITGGEFTDTWTKNMYGKKYQFRNPLKQNYGHMKALQRLLGLPEDIFIPIVVFSSDADIKVKTRKPVVYTTNLKRVIVSYGEKRIDVFNLSGIEDKILAANIDSSETRREHVTQIKKNQRLEKFSIASNVCPRCGGDLVKRNGKYGKFTGCSNFPKCRFTIHK